MWDHYILCYWEGVIRYVDVLNGKLFKEVLLKEKYVEPVVSKNTLGMFGFEQDEAEEINFYDLTTMVKTGSFKHEYYVKSCADGHGGFYISQRRQNDHDHLGLVFRSSEGKILWDNTIEDYGNTSMYGLQTLHSGNVFVWFNVNAGIHINTWVGVYDDKGKKVRENTISGYHDYVIAVENDILTSLNYGQCILCRVSSATNKIVWETKLPGPLWNKYTIMYDRDIARIIVLVRCK